MMARRALLAAAVFSSCLPGMSVALAQEADIDFRWPMNARGGAGPIDPGPVDPGPVDPGPVDPEDPEDPGAPELVEFINITPGTTGSVTSPALQILPSGPAVVNPAPGGISYQCFQTTGGWGNFSYSLYIPGVEFWYASGSHPFISSHDFTDTFYGDTQTLLDVDLVPASRLGSPLRVTIPIENYSHTFIYGDSLPGGWSENNYIVNAREVCVRFRMKEGAVAGSAMGAQLSVVDAHPDRLASDGAELPYDGRVWSSTGEDDEQYASTMFDIVVSGD